MNMSVINISVPSSLKTYVKERVVEKQYGTVSDYIRSLIRSDQKRRERERLEKLLLEGVASVSLAMTSHEVEAWRNKLFKA